MAQSKLLERTFLASGAVLAMAFSAPALAPPASAQEIRVAPPQGAPISFADLIERVRPAVVSISVRTRPGAGGAVIEGAPPGFEEFFRGPRGRGPAPLSLGSGFLISADGTVVTNHHVVEGAEEITVKLSDGREVQAEVVGSDEPTDIAVLRIRGGGRFPFVSFDRQIDVRVGDWVVAVGNPFGLDGTATAGIVSALGRRDAGSSAYVDFLQIDAPINRGNSGGPTFDLRGNVIGVNSAIFSPTGGNVGIGFAIPSDTAARVVDQIIRDGRVSRGWLGVSVQPLDNDIARSLGLDEARGALVASVVADSPAARGGLQQGDVILTFEGDRVEDSRDLTRRVGAFPVGRNARMEILRSGQRRTVQINLAERPAEQTLASAAQPGSGNQAAPATPGSAAGPLGLTVRTLSAEDRARLTGLERNQPGLVIVAVAPNSDLAEKGVQAGDVILLAGGRPAATPEDLSNAVAAARREGRPLLLQIEGRGGRRFVAADAGQG